MEIQGFLNCLELTNSAHGKYCFFSSWNNTDFSFSENFLWAYWFPIAAVTFYCKLRGGGRQQKCILLQFWKPEVWTSFYVAKMKMSPELVTSGGSRGEPVLTSPSFWWPPTFLDLLPHLSSLCFHSHIASSSWSLISLCSWMGIFRAQLGDPE